MRLRRKEHGSMCNRNTTFVVFVIEKHYIDVPKYFKLDHSIFRFIFNLTDFTYDREWRRYLYRK